jgi:hypothetical protein
MSLDILAGWNQARLGAMILAATGSSGPVNITISTGRFAHVDLSDVMGTDVAGVPLYTSLAIALQDALNAAGIGTPWSVTFSRDTGYTITRGGSSFAISFPSTAAGRRFAEVLGFAPGFASGTVTTLTSTRRPIFHLRTASGGKSQSSDIFDARGGGETAETESGRTFYTGRTGRVTHWDWSCTVEPYEAVFREARVDAAPWTWEDFFAHVTGVEPFGVVDDLEYGGRTTVHVLRAGSERFGPQRAEEDFNGSWTVRLATYFKGAVDWTASTVFGSRLAGWWRGDSRVVVSGAVERLWDRSGNGRHVTQATAARRPLPSTLGGRPAIVHDHTQTRWLGTAANISTSGGTNFLVVLVAQLGSSIPAGSAFLLGWNANRGIRHLPPDVEPRIRFTTSDAVAVSNMQSNRLIVMGRSTSNVQAIVNGIVEASSGGVQSRDGRVILGASDDGMGGVDQPVSATIAEAAVIIGAVTDVEIRRLTESLRRRYAI